MKKSVNVIRLQSGDMVSTIKTDKMIWFRADGKVIVQDMDNNDRIVDLYPSDIKYIISIEIDAA